MSKDTVELSAAAAAAARLPVVESTPENSLASLARGSAVHCRRLLTGWTQDPATTIQALLYPALTLLMFRVAFGDTISSATGQPSVYGTVPMITLVAAMTGAVVSGLGLTGEKMSGLLGRFSTMPVHRAAGLVGRLLAEAMRVLVTTLFVLLVGVCIGFRFTQGPLASLSLIGLPVLFGIGFAVLVTALAAVSEGMLLLNIVGIVSALLMFFNSGFVPVHFYPTWLQTTVANQPMSCAIDAMRGLSYGGPVAEPLLKSLAWSLGLVIAFGYPAVRGIRRAASA